MLLPPLVTRIFPEDLANFQLLSLMFFFLSNQFFQALNFPKNRCRIGSRHKITSFSFCHPRAGMALLLSIAHSNALALFPRQKVCQLPPTRMADFERLREFPAFGRLPNTNRAFQPVTLANFP
jgi:hypothetical protein